jgi:hypothetical protein
LPSVFRCISERSWIDNADFCSHLSVLHLLFVVTVFWLTQLPFEWHLGTALHRLLLQGRLAMVPFVFETATLRWAPRAHTGFVRGPTELAELVHAGPAQRQRTV